MLYQIGQGTREEFRSGELLNQDLEFLRLSADYDFYSPLLQHILFDNILL
jgi:hypothetical protein